MWPNIPFLGPKCRIDSLLGGDWWLYIYDKADWGQYAERMRNEVPQIRWSPIKITFGRTFFGWLTFLGVWEHAKNQRGKKRTDMYHFTYVRRFFAKSKQKPIFLLDMVGGTKRFMEDSEFDRTNRILRASSWCVCI